MTDRVALPSGWVCASVGDIVTSDGIFTDGDWVETKDQDPKGDVRLIQLADIGDSSFLDKSSRFLTRAKAHALNCTFLARGDLLVARMPEPLGRCCIFPLDGVEQYVTVVDVCAVRFGTSSISSKYMMYVINSPRTRTAIEAVKSGSTRKRISRGNLSRVEIPLAPQNEQLRIVGKIDELFSELDKGVERLKTARRQLQVYRKSVLKQAFEGKLTSQWRTENKDKLETPKQLLARIKRERAARYEKRLKEWEAAVEAWKRGGRSGKKPLKPPNPNNVSRLSLEKTESLPILPEGWSYFHLGLMIDEPKYGTAKKCGYNYQGTGVLRIPNVIGGAIDASDLKGAQFDEDEKQIYSLESGDVLLVRSNGSISIVGKCALISKSDEQYLFAGYLIRLRSNPAILLPEYLASLLPSHALRTQIEYTAKSTSGVNNINSREIQSLIVPLCSPGEQEVIVERLSSSLSATKAVVAEIDNHLLKAKALRQSILKRAFSGQLVPQDPDDEPASVLLDRIKAERKPKAKSGMVRRRTRKKRATA